MLGSTKKVSTIVKKLQEAGYTAQNLARLRAPIGLNINAQTPSEIAEIISVRRYQDGRKDLQSSSLRHNYVTLQSPLNWEWHLAAVPRSSFLRSGFVTESLWAMMA
jgi:xanthine dehydrogenase accessory factor